MKRKELETEGKKWVQEGIISQQQYEQIIGKYPKKEHQSLLLSFAGIFIGLGFLTFIASNWSGIPNVGRMSIILIAMLAFYLGGEQFYQKGSINLGISFYVIGILIFGAGIFLTGQMFHYTFYSAFPFVIWGLAALLLYVSRQERFLLLLSLIIISVGQVYEATNYQQFNIGLIILTIAAFLLFVKVDKGRSYPLGILFAISFGLQLFLLSIVELYYAMFIPFLILLYILNDIGLKEKLGNSIHLIALLLIFGVNSVHVFLFGFDYFFDDLKMGMLLHISYLILFAAALIIKWIGRDFEHIIDLTLFLPAIYLGSFTDFASLLLLFGFSVGYLILGYQTFSQKKVNIGTATFLVSTVLAYIQLAWDFLDKSLFFFIGGIFLFILSYFLEKRRREVSRHQGGGEK